MQEEKRLKQNKTESTHLASTSKGKGNKRNNETVKNTKDKRPPQKKQYQGKSQNVKNEGCFFCKKEGLEKKECIKYHTWRAKKGTFFNLVCSEVNLSSVPRNTWWVDSGATTNISVSMQGCLSY